MPRGKRVLSCCKTLVHNVANYMEDMNQRKGCHIQVTKRISEKACTPSLVEEMVKNTFAHRKMVNNTFAHSAFSALSHDYRGLEKC